MATWLWDEGQEGRSVPSVDNLLISNLRASEVEAYAIMGLAKKRLDSSEHAPVIFTALANHFGANHAEFPKTSKKN